MSSSSERAGLEERLDVMGRAFPLLTRDDCVALLDASHRDTHPAGSILLAQGSRLQSVFIVQSGYVSVHPSPLELGVAVARMGPGNVFGEMSFVEQGEASANVVADTEVVVDVIESAALTSLLTSREGLAARFYHSLATSLSQRLRESNTRWSGRFIEELPQYTRFHPTRSVSDAVLESELVLTLFAFKREMMDLDRLLLQRKCDDTEATHRSAAALDALERGLVRHLEAEPQLAADIGAHVFREAFPFLTLSRLYDRCLTKPRGYAGDYLTLEMVHDNRPQGDRRLGVHIDRWLLGTPFFRAIQERRMRVCEALRALAAQPLDEDAMRVTCLASGPARELFDLLIDDALPPIEAVCIDLDPDALEHAFANARAYGLEARMRFVRDNPVLLSSGRGSTVLPPQHAIYSVGLPDYLDDDAVVGLCSWMYDNLKPGGTAFLGSIAVGQPNRALIEHLLEWRLVHRTVDEMQRLFARSKFGDAPVEVRTMSAGVNLFAFCRKPSNAP